MSQITEPSTNQWTAADLVERFGPIPLHRVRHDPSPGTATENDVVDIHLREDRLYELADGVLVEKTVGTYESYLALELTRVVANFVIEKDLGVVLDATSALDGGQVLPGFELDLRKLFSNR